MLLLAAFLVRFPWIILGEIPRILERSTVDGFVFHTTTALSTVNSAMKSSIYVRQFRAILTVKRASYLSAFAPQFQHSRIRTSQYFQTSRSPHGRLWRWRHDNHVISLPESSKMISDCCIFKFLPHSARLLYSRFLEMSRNSLGSVAWHPKKRLRNSIVQTENMWAFSDWNHSFDKFLQLCLDEA